MYSDLFNEFLDSQDTLRVYKDGRLLFSSDKDGLRPVLDYLRDHAGNAGAVSFDKIMGNAAALLSVLANFSEVFSPLGSELAIETLEKNGVKYHLTEVVPFITQANNIDMCPMEKLSLDKDSEEFYGAVSSIIG